MRIKTFNLIVALGLLSFPAGRASGELSGKVIGLDPGHGEGYNQGVCIPEGTWVLDGAFRARTHLENRGATVVMTRTTGANPDIPIRYEILNSNNCHLAVSIHSNAAGSTAEGVETFRCELNPHPQDSITLAGHIQNRAVTMVKGPDRGVKECLDAGHGYHFDMLRYTNMPSALPEYYFHTNEYENCQLHNTEAGREEIARSLYAGICDYFEVDPFPEPSPTPETGPTPITVIVDDEDPGFSAVGGAWGISTWGDNYGSQKHYSADGTGAGFAAWTALLPVRGYYAVAAWVADADYTTAARYKIHTEEGVAEVTLSQHRTGGGWSVGLGNHLFSSPAVVEISDDAALGTVVADAVRFTLTGEVATPPPPATATPSSTPSPSPPPPPSATPSPAPSSSPPPATATPSPAPSSSPPPPSATPSPTPSSSTPPPPSATPSPLPPDPDEFRAFMADAWNEGIKDAVQVAAMVETAVDHNYNAVIVQVRKRGDAYYFPTTPNSEPRPAEIAPGFDPLAEVIVQAHSRGLEVIAWINTYLVASPPPAPPPADPGHVFNLHPEFLTEDSGGEKVFSEGYYLDPGHPGANDWNRFVVLDLAANYDLDGLLLDYYRYPAVDSGYNQIAIDRYNSEFGLSGRPDPDDPLFQQWRRRQLSDWLRVLYAEVMDLRPELKVMVSVSQDGDRAYSQHYQDWTGWIEEKYLDAFFPLNYTSDNPIFSDRAGAANLAKGDRHCYMAQGSYLNPKENTALQLASARTAGSEGVVTYSYRHTNNSGDIPAVFYQYIRDNVFSGPAAVPEMDWKSSPVSGIIYGTVADAGTGEGIYNGLVEVAGSARSVRADPGGRYALLDLGAGGYTLTASAEGYRNRILTGVELAAGEVLTVGFELQPELTPEPTPEATPSSTSTPPPPTATPSAQPTPSPSLTPIATPTPPIVRCFQVAGRVVDKDTGVALSGAAARAVCPDRRGSPGETGAAGEYELEICTRFEDGTVRVQARRAGYLPGYVEVAYTDWGDEGVVEVGDLELVRSSVYSSGVDSGDYDGDGRADIAIFRPATGLWAIRGLSRFYFGKAGDELVPADYAGNGTAAAGIFRPAAGLWAIRGLTRRYFGDFGDIPIPGNYRGDGTATIGIFRPAEGLWAIRTFTRAYFGGRYDQPVPGDYAGDGLWNPAVFRSSTGLWALRGVSRFYFGRSGDILVPGDFDGLGYRAAGIFRSSSGLWAIRNATRVYYGRSGDAPVPADYRGTGIDVIGIFRPAGGLWAVKDITRAYYGSSNDLPITR